jgi:VWFA-related protein
MRLLAAGAGAWVMVAGLAVALAQPGVSPQQQTAAAQQQTMPSAPEPNAPQPQALPSLNTITPVAPAVPAEPAPADQSTPTPNSDNAGAPPPSTGGLLPSTPAATQATQDEGPAPEDYKTFTLHPVQVNYVEIPFTVKDSKGHLVPALTWRDVRVYENGVRQQMRVFTTDPFPLSVALVIDQSVTFDTMQKINSSLAALQSAFSPYDEVAVFTYANSVKKQDGFSAAQGARLGVILDRSKVKGREPLMPLGGPMACTTCKNGHGVDPNTDSPATLHGMDAPEREFHTLNDAILQAAQLLATTGRGRRRVIYVISDGKEYGSKAKEGSVIKFLQTNKIELYATLVGDSSIPGMGFLDHVHLPLTMKNDILPRYAAASGGQVDPEFRPLGIQESYQKLSDTMRNQYTVGYYSHVPVLDERYRKVEIRVMRPSLSVIAKDGYYPSPQDSRPMASTPAATATP